MVRLGRQGDGFNHNFAGLPEVGGIVALVGGEVVLGVNLAVRADELDEAGQVVRGGEGLPVKSKGEIGDWRLEIGDLGGVVT